METRTPSKWLTMLAASIGLLMLYVDLFIVNVALPAIQHNFHAPLSTVSWTISGYVLMIGVLPMGIGRLGDIWGQRVVYLAGLIIFSVASLCCGLAANIGFLILFRVLQGVGAAIMTPGTLSIIIRAFPPRQQGLAIGLYGGISGLGLIAGPVLGGLLVQGDNWRWIFFVNVPLGVIALITALLFVPESREQDKALPVDWPGLLLLSIGLLCLLFGFTRAGSSGWLDTIVIASCLLGLVLLVLFTVVERHVRYPLIDLSLFRNAPFVMGCLSFFLFSAALFGSQPYVSLFMQNTWGFTPIQGGLAFLPATGIIALFTPLTGIMAQWAGARRYVFIIVALLAMGLSFLFMAVVLTPTSTYANGLLPAFIVRGFAIPIVSSFTTLAVISAVPKKQAGLASGTFGMARNIGTAFGVAVLSQVYLFHINQALPASLGASRAAAEQFIVTGTGTTHAIIEAVILQGFKITAIACALFCLVAVVATLLMRTHVQQPAMEQIVSGERNELIPQEF
jgi:DHA2 family methylenomycin A resistance protein-like MFS transporter